MQYLKVQTPLHSLQLDKADDPYQLKKTHHFGLLVVVLLQRQALACTSGVSPIRTRLTPRIRSRGPNSSTFCFQRQLSKSSASDMRWSERITKVDLLREFSLISAVLFVHLLCHTFSPLFCPKYYIRLWSNCKRRVANPPGQDESLLE